MTEQCSNCRYYDGEKGEAIGLCRRHAPVVDEGSADAVWPITYPAEWCGEFSEAWEAAETLSVPDAGARYFDLSRNGSYLAAQRGDIPTVMVGGKMRVPLVALRRMMGAPGT